MPVEPTDTGGALKAVQIGCGGRAQTHARALAGTNRLDLVAVCDLDEAKAKRTAETHAVPRTYVDFRRMLDAEHPDVVAFIAPPAIRSEVILPILEYRPKALVIEKPMAVSLDEAEAIAAAADDAGTRLVVSHQCRYAQEMVKLHEIVHSGRLGTIAKVLVNCRLGLLGQGTHMLDLVEMILTGREARWVLAQMDGVKDLYACGGSAHPGPDHAMLQIGYDGGVVAFASIGNRSPAVPEHQAVPLHVQAAAIGSDGYAEATLAYGWKALFADGSADCRRSPAFDDNAYMTRALYDEVADVLAGTTAEHQAGARGALRVQRLIDSAYESSIQGRAIALPHRPPSGTLARARHRMAANRPVVTASLLYGHHPRGDALREIASTGCQFVDLWMHASMAPHFDPHTEDVDGVRSELDALGLSVPMVSYYGSEPVEAKIRAAHRLGARVAVTCAVDAERLPGAVESLKSALDLAGSLGMTIAFENHMGTIESVEDMQAFLGALDHPAASICLAPTHLVARGVHPEVALAELGDRVSVLYLWDMSASLWQAGLGGWPDGDGQTPGSSDLDFRSILEAAIRHCPSALWTLAWHGTEDWPVERVTGAVGRAMRHIDRCRPLTAGMAWWG